MRASRRGFLKSCAVGLFALGIEWRLGNPAPKALVANPTPRVFIDDFRVVGLGWFATKPEGVPVWQAINLERD